MKNTNDRYLVELVSTTLETVNAIDLRKKTDKALLLNSLLSLVVLPLEEKKKNNHKRMFEGSYTGFSKNLGVSPQFFQPIKTCDSNTIKYENKTIYAFIRAFRNSIAHQNILFGDDGKTVSFHNKFYSKKCKNCELRMCTQKGVVYDKSGVITFIIDLDYKHLRKFAKYVAISFMKSCSITKK